MRTLVLFLGPHSSHSLAVGEKGAFERLPFETSSQTRISVVLHVIVHADGIVPVHVAFLHLHHAKESREKKTIVSYCRKPFHQLQNGRKRVFPTILSTLPKIWSIPRANHGKDPIAASSSDRSSFPFPFVSRCLPAHRMINSRDGQLGSSTVTSGFVHCPSASPPHSTAFAVTPNVKTKKSSNRLKQLYLIVRLPIFVV